MAFLAGAGVLAGLSGSMGGLASLASYPALLVAGLSPTAANVTNSVGLVATTIGAAGGSRPELAGQGRYIARLSAVRDGEKSHATAGRIPIPYDAEGA